MVKLLSTISLILALVLFPPAALALVSNNAVPGDVTYPIKRTLEDIIFAAASIHPTTKAWFAAARSDRRFKEFTTLVTQGKKTGDVLNELVEQTQIAANQIADVGDESQKKKLVEQLSESIKKYDQGLQQLSPPSQAEPTPPSLQETTPAQTPQATLVPDSVPTPAPTAPQPTPLLAPQPTPAATSFPTPTPVQQSNDEERQRQIEEARKKLEEIRRRLEASQRRQNEDEHRLQREGTRQQTREEKRDDKDEKDNSKDNSKKNKD